MLKPFSHILFRCPLQSLAGAFNPSPEITPIFQEGLYLSSPEFLTEWNRKEQLSSKECEKLELSFSKYWLRSSSRCTPYGTFAGAALATISNAGSNIVLAPSGAHRRKLRLDMNYMSEIIKALMQIPVIQEQLLFVPNNSLYPAANALRYAEYHIRNNMRSYHLTSVDHTPYLERALLYASRGAAFQELAKILEVEEGVTAAEAKDYIEDLWMSQILVPLLEPAVTGPEPLDQVIAHLEQMKDVDAQLSQLKEIQLMLNNPGEGTDFYEHLLRKLDGLELGITVPKNTIQADLFLMTKEAVLNEELINAVVRQAEELKALARPNRNGDLEDFKSRFFARYENEFVPLSIAIDADLGIGYAGAGDQSVITNEWLDGLMVAGYVASSSATPLDDLQQLSLGKYHDWLVGKKPYIELTEEELNNNRERTKGYTFPDSMFLMGSLMKKEGMLDVDQFCFNVSSFGGPSAANLLGRFTHGDQQLASLTREILQKEEEGNPDVIYAEIAHLPQARIGNILLRPVLRNYEIPYVGLSGAPQDSQIMVDDLYVSVKRDQVLLWSKKFNKRVMPRLTTAHNFGYSSLPVYKFLCDLQGQGMAYGNVWDWGSLAGLKHLPGVRYKNLILQKARWKIDETDIKDLPQQENDYPDWFNKFRSRLDIPGQVVYKEGDNELLIDFCEQLGIKLFLHYLRRYKNIVIEEFLFSADNCIVTDEAGNHFTNEMIIPLYNDTSLSTSAISEQTKRDAAFQELDVLPQRKFSVYSQWLYFKIYCGNKSAEKILTQVLMPFVDQSLAAEAFEQFFFIRYQDESGSHLRIRFLNTVLDKQLLVYRDFMLVLQPFLEQGTISKVVLDSYSRELERYVPALIHDTETLFFNDSYAVLHFINLLDDSDHEQYRVLFALRGIDILLNDFGLKPDPRLRLMKQLQTSFFNEFGAYPQLKKQLNDRYRKHQQFFTSHFDASKDELHEIDEAVKIFRVRSAWNKPVVEDILTYLNNAEIGEGKLFDLLGSYIHMFMNRLFVAQQRKHELVVYHFLERYYNSQGAISKKKSAYADIDM